MRIRKTYTKNTTQYAIIYDVNINGKRTTKIYENFGTIDKIKNESLPVILKKSPVKRLEKDKLFSFNGGYLFLQNLYYKLGINNICEDITNKYQFKYDLNDILSRLIYTRVIYPSSKLKSLELSKKFLEQPNFEYQHILSHLFILLNRKYHYIKP